jgi:hypothetical protein
MAFPILGPPSTNVSFNTEAPSATECCNVVRVTHEGYGGWVTSVKVHLPPDTSDSPFAASYQGYEIHLSLKHALHDDWASIVMRLCGACDAGDLPAWEAAWAELRALTLRARRTEGAAEGTEAAAACGKVFSEPGWSAGACGKALFHANRAAGAGVPGASAVLDRLLATCDLTPEDVRAMFKAGADAEEQRPIVRRRVPERAVGEWILLVDVAPRVWANRALLERFGLDATTVVQIMASSY